MTIEDLTSQIDGFRDTFVVAQPIARGSLEVWLDGLYLGTSRHFTELDAITFKISGGPPHIGEELVVEYALEGDVPATTDEITSGPEARPGGDHPNAG